MKTFKAQVMGNGKSIMDEFIIRANTPGSAGWEAERLYNERWGHYPDDKGFTVDVEEITQ